MSFLDGDGFMADPFQGFLGAPKIPKQEKGIAWEAKVIDGKYYIPLSQVAELLRNNNVLPLTRTNIERRVDGLG